MTKAEARMIARGRRAALVNPSAASALVERFPAHLTHKSVAGFAPIGDEIDVWRLLRHLHEQGRTIGLPVTPSAPGPLTFRRWTPGCEMRTDRHGVSYPDHGEELTPQLLLIPLLAFTPEGQRLGYGGGYYDRTLAALRSQGDVFACGVAYAGQEVAALPTNVHDADLDGILTEKEFRTFR